MKTLLRLSASLLALLLLAPTALARPGNAERYPVGVRALGMGGASVALGHEPWQNPAGLGRVRQEGLSGSLNAYGLTMEEVPRWMDVQDEESSMQGAMRTTSVDLFPLDMAYVKPMGEMLGMTHGAGLSIVVPDYYQFSGELDVPAADTEIQDELRARIEEEVRTFWITPAWGACSGKRFCVGLGPVLAIHMEKRLHMETWLTTYEDGSSYDDATSDKSSFTAAGVGGQLGVQLQPVDGLWIGLTARTPIWSVYGSGSILNIYSIADSEEGEESFIDRVEVPDAQVEYRMPWRFGFGLAWEKPNRYAIAADVRLHLAQEEYMSISGPNGEIEIAPKRPEGIVEDEDRSMYIARWTALEQKIDFAVGGEVYLTDTFAMQLGAFSDFTATSDERVIEHEVTAVSNIGATLGLGFKGKESTTWLSLVYRYGWGKALGQHSSPSDPDGFGEEVAAELNAHGINILLGSTKPL